MDFTTLVIYSLYSLSTVGIAYVAERNRSKILALFSYIICVIFWGIRKDIGFDYIGYVEIFKDIQFGGSSYVELGYYLLNKFFTPYKDGFIGVFILSSAITFGFIFFTFWRNRILWQGLLYSLVFQYQFMAANQVRQAMAIAIFISFVHFLQNKQYLKYTLSVILTTLLVHSSAIFLLLGIPLSLIHFNKYAAVIIILLIYLLYIKGYWSNMGYWLFSIIPVPESYSHYLLTERVFSEYVGFSLIQLFNVSLGIYIIWNGIAVPKYILSLYIFGLMSYIIFIEYHLFLRISFYFSYLNIVALSIICKAHPRRTQIITFISILFFLLICCQSSNMHGVIPYRSIL